MKSLKVLLLEDQPFQMMAMCRMLNSIGVSNVLMADSADSATQLLERHRHVDITICDLQMKGADGLDFIRYLSETDYAGALIIVSSSEVGILSCVARMAHESGISVLGYLEKPASSSHFRVLFDKFMAQPRPQEDLRSAFYSQKVVTVQEVTKALQESELVAYFQPKVAMNGLVVGVEALVRWPHSTLGMLSPAQFLPVIESAGLSDQLMWFMLEQALSVAARQELQDGSALPVAVNISPEVLLQRDFSRRVLALVAKYALSPEVLTLEIVESVFSTSSPARIESLTRLRMSGCKVAIDDFGTGASNMQRLFELPISDLKVPAEFVTGMGRDVRLRAIVEGALIMARRMGLTVTVEGVESLDDYQALSLLGEPCVQGYFIARPMSEKNLAQWLIQHAQAFPG